MKYCFLILICVSVVQCTMFQSRKPNPPDLKGRISTDMIRDLIVSDSLETELTVDTARVYDFNDLIEIHECVFLESDEHFMTGQIDKVILHRERIFILDMHIAQTVFIFDRKGKFIQKIPKLNKNSFFRDMELDTVKQQLVIYDRNHGKLLCYDLNGLFVETINLGLRFSNFKMLPDGNYALFTNNNQNDFNPSIESNGFLIGHPNGNILFRAFPNDHFLKNMNYSGPFNLFYNRNQLYICPRLTNTVYRIDSSGTLLSLYKFHLPNGSMDEYALLNPKDFRNDAANNGLYYSLGDYCMMSDSVVFFKYFTPGHLTQTVWYHRRTGAQYSVSGMFSSACGFMNPLVPFDVQNNRFISVAHPGILKCFPDDKRNAFLQNDILKKDDNLFIVIYSIKWVE